MAVCYEKLWDILDKKNMKRTDLKEASGISFNVLARLGKEETVSLESIEKICTALDCNIGEMMDVVTDNHCRKPPNCNNKLNIKS